MNNFLNIFLSSFLGSLLLCSTLVLLARLSVVERENNSDTGNVRNRRDAKRNANFITFDELFDGSLSSRLGFV